MVQNNISKSMELTVDGKKFIVEYTGFYKNLHFEFSKGLAGIFGVIGLKLIDFTYSERDIYSRFDLVTTNLINEKSLKRREREKLYLYNLEMITNLYKIVEDEDRYFWIKMSEDKDLLIDFSRIKKIMRQLKLCINRKSIIVEK